jgi:hypothetical protein
MILSTIPAILPSTSSLAVVSLIDNRHPDITMKIDGIYEFSELTNIEGIFVSNGRERATGKIIQIHLFPAAKAAQANRICQQLFSVPDDARAKILKYGQEGSASYFVTEPLPAGEYLQSWIERLSTRPQSSALPEMRQGITTQLREMGIAPSPLAPIMPGPESSPKGSRKVQDALVAPNTPDAGRRPDQTGEMTREFRSIYPAATRPPDQTGEMTREFRGIYGERDASSELPPDEFHVEVTPDCVPVTEASGLDKWIFDRAVPDATGPKTEPVSPAPIAPFPEEAPRPLPILDIPSEPDWRSAQPLNSERAEVPVMTPLPAKKAPSSSPRTLDWKTVMLFAGALLAVAGLVVVIVETSA